MWRYDHFCRQVERDWEIVRGSCAVGLSGSEYLLFVV